MSTVLTIGTAFYALKQGLDTVYDTQESAAICHEVMEHITGLGKLQRITAKDVALNSEQLHQLDSMKARLLTGEPLQYVMGVQWFMGRPFHVNKHVLIPRPETEELVLWVTDDWEEQGSISVLDIGTGSGCIPISLKLQLVDATIWSCDISKEALEVAQQNAASHHTEVHFTQLDFLDEQMWQQLAVYDVIVSNPPYIPMAEKNSLDKNVRDFEPGTALFVPDDDALLFYRKIAQFGKDHLKPDGAIYCELHRDHAEATKVMFQQAGYNVWLRQDMHGNNRMLKACK